MRLAICDDSLQEQNQIEQALQGWDSSRHAEKYFDGASLLEAARNNPPFDMVFMDIYLPGENGMEIAAALRRISPETGIVFVTTSRDHAIDAFSLDALHYLVKPVTTQGIVESFRRLTQQHIRRQESISLMVEGDMNTISLSKICYLERSNHYVEVSLRDGRKLMTRTPLYELEQRLGRRFLRINRGLVVNMDYIERMGTDRCVLENGAELFLASRDRGAIRAAYNEYLLSRLSRDGKEVGY